jgi:hypothetical protein
VIRTVFRSEDLPPAERLAAFDAFLHTCEPPMRVTSAAPDRFRATARARDLGPLHILELTSSPSVIRRTRRSDPAVCAVVFPLRGTLTVSQKGREALLRGQDFTFYDSSLPLRLGIAGPEPTTLLRVQVPRSLLPPPARHADRLAGTRLPDRRDHGHRADPPRPPGGGPPRPRRPAPAGGPGAPHRRPLGVPGPLRLHPVVPHGLRRTAAGVPRDLRTSTVQNAVYATDHPQAGIDEDTFICWGTHN